MLHAAPLVNVLDLEFAQFFTAQGVIEQGRQNGAVAFAFKRAGVGCFEQRARLVITKLGGREHPAFGCCGQRGDEIGFRLVVHHRSSWAECSASPAVKYPSSKPSGSHAASMSSRSVASGGNCSACELSRLSTSDK